MKCIVGQDVVLSRPLEGPLSAYIPDFAKWVCDQGYSLYSRHRHVRLAAGFSHWLEQEGIDLSRIGYKPLNRYLRSHARQLKVYRGDVAALKQFVVFLHRLGAIPEEMISRHPLSPVEQAVCEYESYLLNDRALATATATNYVPFIRLFLEGYFARGAVKLSRLCACDVIRFVQHHAKRMHLKRAKLLATALRSFLHYLRYRGEIELDLAAAVPIVANWSMTSIPRGIPPDLVRRLLASINRHTAMGRRDYAILLLLARMGLRAGEIAGLELEDIDWKSGTLRVRRKGGQRSTLPLPTEVGAAIAAYLRHGRPQKNNCRCVFIRSRAPVRGFLGAVAITSVVRNNLARAGIKAPTKGAHQFRHGLATDMLRHGASLMEIGEILGHRSPETTRIYTKVDLNALRPLALAWPGLEVFDEHSPGSGSDLFGHATRPGIQAARSG
jgi:site-specific recombinase XerD